ncbi:MULTISPECIES: hypothetical protein [unclassified Gilliamella]|uniref:hypothetical protein n=1 Tax=unclassified Gilliamella TaxID=2685620 RepID=UPI00080DEBD4|nr:hypothetical protein [Gilliamella apicola]OCG18573.1 hypothetical protein A9G23_10740 [Gilliamella apicola]OCG24400.1 hypothetical protein A9G22_04610 [Gilliamella apicola]
MTSNKKFLKTMVYTIYLLQFSTISHAALSTKSTLTIQGNKPKLSDTIENNIEDFELFGLTLDGKNYYGDEVRNMPLPVSYSFLDRIQIAPLKQPDDSQYLDIDGDELGILNTKEPPKITWYYTNQSNQLVEFTPTKSDTFCSLAKNKKLAPYKVKISADLILSSKYGDPKSYEYPNENIIKQPSKTYTILSESGFCYARPELAPIMVDQSFANQWDATNGFLVQSTIDPTKNFPTTGFYGAKFDLVFAQPGSANNYNWTLVKGSELVTISNNADIVTVKFNTPQALNNQTAWEHVMRSDNGYTVIIQGINKTSGNIIQYPFTITKWFTGWDIRTQGQAKASKGEVDAIIAGCNSLKGKYRISHANEVSNAPMGKKGDASYTREIGTLLGEWGDPSQEAYPNSWAAKIKGNHDQGKSYQRIWVWDTHVKNYCDYHPYNAKYHCKKETQEKNGICTAIK